MEIKCMPLFGLSNVTSFIKKIIMIVLLKLKERNQWHLQYEQRNTLEYTNKYMCTCVLNHQSAYFKLHWCQSSFSYMHVRVVIILTNDCFVVRSKFPGQTQTINSLIQTMRASGLDIQDEEGLLHLLLLFIWSLFNTSSGLESPLST